MAENDIIALKELAGESYQEIALTASDLKLGTTSGLPIKTGNGGVLEASSFGTSAGTFCEGNDARLSDARTPSSTLAHASSHAATGSDPLLPSDIGAQSIFVTEALGTITANVTLTAARAKIYTVNTTTAGLRILLPTTGVIAGDVVVISFTSSTGQTLTPVRGTMTGFFTDDLRPSDRVTFIAASSSGTSWYEENGVSRFGAELIFSGTVNAARLPIGTTAGTVAAGDHTHTQLHDRSHAITSASDHTAGNNKIFYSDNTGAITELALGAANTVLTSNGTTSAPTFAAAAAPSNMTGATSSTAGAAGLVPQPAAGQNNMFLLGDATFGTIHDLFKLSTPLNGTSGTSNGGERFWRTTPFFNIASGGRNLNADYEWVCPPLLIPSTRTWKFGVYCYDAKPSSAIRLAIYNISYTTGRPTTIIEDLGEMDTTTTGEKTVTSSVNISKGWVLPVIRVKGSNPGITTADAGDAGRRSLNIFDNMFYGWKAINTFGAGAANVRMIRTKTYAAFGTDDLSSVTYDDDGTQVPVVYFRLP